MDETVLYEPPSFKKFKKSQCTPLFMNAYTMRGAGAVIHTHSKNCVMVTLLYPGTEFRITHQEMIKGVRKGQSGVYYRYDEELVIPIVENTPHEEDLKVGLLENLLNLVELRLILFYSKGENGQGDE
jgi:ribulose-5-phosphate 4-epimerase/fuculose-1-phosphate aldolase